jgi:hypothetical protein
VVLVAQKVVVPEHDLVEVGAEGAVCSHKLKADEKEGKREAKHFNEGEISGVIDGFAPGEKSAAL